MRKISAKSHKEALRKLNKKIGDAENRGDSEWLAGILAPRLAFQRADDEKTVDDRTAFLKRSRRGLARNPHHRTDRVVWRSGNRQMHRHRRRPGVSQYAPLRTPRRRLELLAWANERV